MEYFKHIQKNKKGNKTSYSEPSLMLQVTHGHSYIISTSYLSTQTISKPISNIIYLNINFKLYDVRNWLRNGLGGQVGGRDDVRMSVSDLQHE